MGEDLKGLDDIRESVERIRRGLALPERSSLQDVVRRGRRRRLGRSGAAALIGITLVLGVTLPLRALSPLGESTRIPPGTTPAGTPTTTPPGIAPTHPGWVDFQLPAEGLSIQTPPDWNLIQVPNPALSHPSSLFEIASYYAPAAPSDGCAPTDAISKLPDDQVVFWLDEWGSPSDTNIPFAPRADPFVLQNLSSYECAGGQPGYLTRFSDAGRYFLLFAVFGPHARDGLRQRVIDSLSSLRVDPLGAPGPGTDAAASWLSPPTFDPVPGWLTQSTSANGSSLQGGGGPMTWASNVPFDPADLGTMTGGALTGGVWPQHTINSLPTDGVVIVADVAISGYTAPSDSATFPVRPAPLDVHDAIGPVEGGKQFVLTAAVNEQFVEIRFFYGTDTPSPAQLQAAQDELDRLVVPSLPPAA